MRVILRNITKDNMKDFSNDQIVYFPMEEDDLKNLLGNDEWIIVDSPIGNELTNILGLNQLLTEKEEDMIKILQAAGYLFEEIKNHEFAIVDFDSETSQWNTGNGVVCDDWWKGYVLHKLGYVRFPFHYTDEMEDWVRFDTLWTQAEAEGWRDATVNIFSKLVSKTYLVNMFES